MTTHRFTEDQVERLAELVTDNAACIGMDPDLWFPKEHSPDAYAAARRVCASCPVRESCADLGEICDPQWNGMWGGLDPDQRKERRRARRLKALNGGW